MPRAHKTFRLGRAPTEDDRLSFELVGHYTNPPADGPDEWSETFTCVGLAPAGVLEDLTTTMSVDALTGRRRYSTMACLGFIHQVLIPDDEERFDVLMHDKNRIVGLIEMVEVTAWLSDMLTLRPTGPSSGSTPGGGTTEAEAMRAAAASIAASTPTT